MPVRGVRDEAVVPRPVVLDVLRRLLAFRGPSDDVAPRDVHPHAARVQPLGEADADLRRGVDPREQRRVVLHRDLHSLRREGAGRKRQKEEAGEDGELEARAHPSRVTRIGWARPPLCDAPRRRGLLRPGGEHLERRGRLPGVARDARVEGLEVSGRLCEQVLDHLLHVRVLLRHRERLHEVVALLRLRHLALARREVAVLGEVDEGHAAARGREQLRLAQLRERARQAAEHADRHVVLARVLVRRLVGEVVRVVRVAVGLERAALRARLYRLFAHVTPRRNLSGGGRVPAMASSNGEVSPMSTCAPGSARLIAE